MTLGQWNIFSTMCTWNTMTVYKKQFEIPDHHRPFLEESLAVWLKMGVVQKSDSLSNSPVFCEPKKDGMVWELCKTFANSTKNHTWTKTQWRPNMRALETIANLNQQSFLLLTSHPDFGKCLYTKSQKEFTLMTGRYTLSFMKNICQHKEEVLQWVTDNNMKVNLAKSHLGSQKLHTWVSD